jgi:hypothetical protein
VLERASGQFTIEGNVEDIFGGVSGATRIARISQTILFTGALQGESIAEYTAVLPREADGSFQGFQRISGALGEREGTFVVSVTGEYAKGQPRGSWSIVPKSGSGDFVHIRGSGTFSQAAGKAGSYKLEFDLRKPRKTRAAGSVDEPAAGELIPGIDIVEEDEPTPKVETFVAAPIDETPVGKPARRPRKKPAAPVSAVVESAVVELEIAPIRSRKKTQPIAVEASPGAEETAAPAAARKRTRANVEVEPGQTSPAATAKSKPPVRTRRRPSETSESAVEAAVVTEPVSKPRRTRSASPVEQSAVEAQLVNPPARKRSRKPAADVVSSAVAEAPPKHRRKPAETPKPPVAESAPVVEPKPARRKKTSAAPPEEPLPLPVAQDKPARPRKAKAA